VREKNPQLIICAIAFVRFGFQRAHIPRRAFPQFEAEACWRAFNSQEKMAARDGIEPPSRAFQGLPFGEWQAVAWTAARNAM